MGSNTRRPKNAPICLHRGPQIEKLCACGGYKPDANYRYVRRQLNRAYKLRAMGKGRNVSAEEFAAARRLIVEAHDEYGMSHREIAEVIECHHTWPVKVYGNHTKTMRRERYHTILSRLPVRGFRPVRRKAPSGARTSAVGAQRRIRALLADGFTCQFLGEHLGWTLASVSKFAHETKGFVFASTDREMRDAYNKLAGTDPRDYGISEQASKAIATIARNNEWEPSICWDDDTIDDPAAFAEWTGECGTVSGYNLHRKHQIHVRVSPDRHGNERTNVLCEACCRARVAEKRATEDKLAARRAECEAFLNQGKAMRWIADELSMSTRTVQRVKRDMDNDKE